MRFNAAVLLLVLAANDGGQAYSPSFIPKNLGSSTFVANRRATSITTPNNFQPHAYRHPKASTNSGMTMFAESSGGIEELQEFLDTSTAAAPLLSKQVRKSPSFFKMASLATVPLSAAVGFLSVPSRRFAAHTVGAVVTGIVGAVGKSRLDLFTEEHAKPAVVQAIVDNGIDGCSTAISAVQQQFGVVDFDFEVICTEIYATYLMGMVKYSPRPKISDLDELEQLKNSLSLGNLQVGEAHAMAAENWYRQISLKTSEEDLHDPDHPDRQAMNKLLFLTERALRRNEETEEAFRFEMARVAKAVKIDFGEAIERVAETAEPFYLRALASARAKLGTGQVNPKMLEKARKTLGIKEDVAFDLHVAAFNQEVRELLGVASSAGSGSDSEPEDEPIDYSQVAFKKGSMERLTKLRDILGLSETDAVYEITVEATPAYQNTAITAMNSVLAKSMSPDEAWDIMDRRREELLLGTDSTKALVSSMVMQALGGPLEETNKFAKVNNEAATYNQLIEALEARAALVAILAKSGWEEFDGQFDDSFCNPWDKKSANGFLVSEERIRMYRIFINRAALKAVDGMLTDEMHDRILQVKGLLGITDQQAEIESRNVFGKKLKGIMKQATMEMVEDYTEELAKNMREQLDAVIEGYRLSEDYVRESGMSFYTKAVELTSDKSPGGIPSDEMAAALKSLREMFKLTVEETAPAHSEFFGAVYRKSILEAMGQTGVIRPELREGLEKLRQRLGVSEESSKGLYLKAVEEKMKPMVEWVGSEMERTLLTRKQLSRRRGKDMGEDVFQTGKGADGVLGLGAEVNIMSDIMELVDFYVENDLIEEVETDATDDNGEKISKKVYPVTALGMCALDQELAELLYRQFIVGAFQSQGPNAARYEQFRETFAGILGLSESTKEEVGKTIGNTVYDNFITNALTTKGSMDQQDLLFIANIQGKLGLTNAQSQEMVLAAQKKVLSEELEDLLDAPTPEGAKAFREKCNSLGLDLLQDIGMSKQRLTKLFECEIIPGLKSGELSAEETGTLTDIQQSLGLDEEECESMFMGVLNTLAKNSYNIIRGEILRGREDNVVDPIKDLVRYAQFTGGELGLDVDESTGQKIISLYDAFDFDGLSEEKIEENKELLRATCGL